VHVETAVWTRAALDAIDLPAGARALDIGSSTLHYRTVEQPHIEQQVLAPLRARGVTVVHLDAKAAAGVDVVCDLDDADERIAERLGEHALVLLTSVLHYLRQPERAADLAVRTLAPGGHLIAHHPQSARRTYDPLDRGLRMSPDELAGLFEARGLERVHADSVRIDDPRYYRRLVSRPSWIPVGRFWVPLPGVSERARLRIPALRWRQSCVVMRRPGSVAP
jgi:SAM-dependent methyltransferase